MPWTPPPGGVDDEHRYNAGERRAVEQPRGAEEKLPQVHGAAVDIAAHQVGVVPLERGRRQHVRARMRPRKPGAKRSTWDSMASVMSAVEPLGTWQ